MLLEKHENTLPPTAQSALNCSQVVAVRWKVIHYSCRSSEHQLHMADQTSVALLA